MNEQSYFWKNGGLQFMENFFLIILMILNGFLGKGIKTKLKTLV